MNESSETPDRVIREVLKVLPDNNYQAGDMIGVSEGTIRNWRARKYPKTLQPEVRQAIDARLKAGQTPLSTQDAARLRSLVGEMKETAEKVMRMLDSALGISLPETQVVGQQGLDATRSLGTDGGTGDEESPDAGSGLPNGKSPPAQ